MYYVGSAPIVLLFLPKKLSQIRLDDTDNKAMYASAISPLSEISSDGRPSLLFVNPTTHIRTSSPYCTVHYSTVLQVSSHGRLDNLRVKLVNGI